MPRVEVELGVWKELAIDAKRELAEARRLIEALKFEIGSLDLQAVSQSHGGAILRLAALLSWAEAWLTRTSGPEED